MFGVRLETSLQHSPQDTVGAVVTGTNSLIDLVFLASFLAPINQLFSSNGAVSTLTPIV